MMILSYVFNKLCSYKDFPHWDCDWGIEKQPSSLSIHPPLWVLSTHLPDNDLPRD